MPRFQNFESLVARLRRDFSVRRFTEIPATAESYYRTAAMLAAALIVASRRRATRHFLATLAQGARRLWMMLRRRADADARASRAACFQSLEYQGNTSSGHTQLSRRATKWAQHTLAAACR